MKHGRFKGAIIQIVVHLTEQELYAGTYNRTSYIASLLWGNSTRKPYEEILPRTDESLACTADNGSGVPGGAVWVSLQHARLVCTHSGGFHRCVPHRLRGRAARAGLPEAVVHRTESGDFTGGFGQAARGVVCRGLFWSASASGVRVVSSSFSATAWRSVCLGHEE